MASPRSSREMPSHAAMGTSNGFPVIAILLAGA
jgi:hypothetical protein